MSLGLSDRAIVEGLQSAAQTKVAFEHLYKQVYPAVRQQIRAFGGNEDDARDVFQEGVLALWKNVQAGKFELRADAKLSTYLVEICKRRWIDQKKKASSRYEQTPEQLPDQADGPNPLENWIDREEQDAFREKFRQLGERCRDMLTRFYYEKQPLREIAAVFGIGDSTAKNEKYRCMQRLKQIFNTANQRS